MVSLLPSTELEPGDRFELSPIPVAGRILLPDFFRAVPIQRVTAPDGRAWEVAPGPSLVAPTTGWAPPPDQALWLVYQDGAFRLLPEPLPPSPTEVRTDIGVPITQ